MEIRPITGSKPAADVAADLRDLADLAEHDPFIATVIADIICDGSTFPAHAVGHEHEHQRREVMAEAVRRLKPVATGPVAKEYSQHGLFYAKVPLRAIILKLVDLRESVCERVVTSVETVTEEVVDPDYVAPTPPMVTRTREAETVEWKCVPLLAAESAEASA
uniref:hypothetical protein n=1 Tax=Micromonospora sp. NBC_00855 TaxID=2975978 RepID=UPI0022560791|nr:hypothetical protein OHB51_35475 [Micromonospora sp. NBC_00855]